MATVQDNLPCFIITVRNLMITFELGLMRTCLLPRFSAVDIAFKASASTFMRTILVAEKDNYHAGFYTDYILGHNSTLAISTW